MITTFPTTGTRLALPVKDGGAVAPIPLPVIGAPVYVPVGAPVPPNPIIALPPVNQFRGAGGTPFIVSAGGSQPPVYRPAIIPTYIPNAYDIPVVDTFNPQDPAAPMIIAPAPDGTKSNILPPKVRPPAKPPVTGNPTPTVMPGPISGTVAGFDLTRIPLWAWLAGAALLGARLLK